MVARIACVVNPPMSPDDPRAVIYQCDEPGCANTQPLPVDVLLDVAQPIYCERHSPFGETPWRMKVGDNW